MRSLGIFALQGGEVQTKGQMDGKERRGITGTGEQCISSAISFHSSACVAYSFNPNVFTIYSWQ
jgi:hypothetical protein